MRDLRPEDPTWITTGILRKSFYALFDAITKYSVTQKKPFALRSYWERRLVSIARYLRPTTKSQKHDV